jgi:hypothetical protein
MDRKQLITIVVTVVMSTIAKEVFTWLVAFAKTQAATATTKAKVKKIFNKNNLIIIWDLFSAAWMLLILIQQLHKTTPITRYDILLIPVLLFSIVFLCCHVAFIWGVIRAQRERSSRFPS